MADALSQELPLVSGGENDWISIFSRWGAMQYDTSLATINRILEAQDALSVGE